MSDSKQPQNVQPFGAGATRPGCNYLNSADSICNKCGRMHYSAEGLLALETKWRESDAGRLEQARNHAMILGVKLQGLDKTEGHFYESH